MVKVTDTKTQSLNVNHGIWQVYVCIFNCHFIHFLLAKNSPTGADTEKLKMMLFSNNNPYFLLVIFLKFDKQNFITFQISTASWISEAIMILRLLNHYRKRLLIKINSLFLIRNRKYLLPAAAGKLRPLPVAGWI